MEAMEHASQQAERVLNKYGLGRMRIGYRDLSRKDGWEFIVYFLLGLLILVSYVVAIPDTPPEIRPNMYLALFTGCVFFLWGMIGLSIMVTSLWKGVRRLYLGDQGFVLTRRRVEIVARWDTEVEIHRHMRAVSTRLYTIVTTKGKRYS